jgi:hypothetical protein
VLFFQLIYWRREAAISVGVLFGRFDGGLDAGAGAVGLVGNDPIGMGLCLQLVLGCVSIGFEMRCLAIVLPYGMFSLYGS